MLTFLFPVLFLTLLYVFYGGDTEKAFTKYGILRNYFGIFIIGLVFIFLIIYLLYLIKHRNDKKHRNKSVWPVVIFIIILLALLTWRMFLGKKMSKNKKLAKGYGKFSFGINIANTLSNNLTRK